MVDSERYIANNVEEIVVLFSGIAHSLSADNEYARHASPDSQSKVKNTE